VRAAMRLVRGLDGEAGRGRLDAAERNLGVLVEDGRGCTSSTRLQHRVKYRVPEI
jgi:hypothetical protein